MTPETKAKKTFSEPATEIDATVRDLWRRYQEVRDFSEQLCRPLATEDFVIQSMPDVSPTRWHLAHTSWFFETFVLVPHSPGYRSPNSAYSYLFNSYYNAVGDKFSRPHRGLLSRPTVKAVFEYRAHVDNEMMKLPGRLDGKALIEIAPIVEIGIHHEQQHQELMLTDIKHVFSINPLRPAYEERKVERRSGISRAEWLAFREGIRWIGHEGGGFAYDNESPRHREFLNAFRLASRPVTNGEYLEFIKDRGYQRPEFWLSDGWAAVETLGWKAPLYWEQRDGSWWIFTLSGMREIDPAEPVCHVSYFEADAFARWAGARLPTEAEWETAAADIPIAGNFVEDKILHPAASIRERTNGRLSQIFGDVWEWMQSHYSPYPGYRPVAGALGEYNGKFMCNQFVLRGGSCATSITHIRPTYRNFFPAASRWQFSGVRLAQDGEG